MVATRLEAAAARRATPRLRVLRVGMGVRTVPASLPLAISMGLAGGLQRDAEPGTVVVATSVSGPDGSATPCDAQWVEALLAAARSLGLRTVHGQAITTARLVTGADRARLADRGFVAVDLESSVIATHASRLAVCRVILDTPHHEIDIGWSRPAAAVLDPRRWREGVWMARHAPGYARRAADVVARAWAQLRSAPLPVAR